jgi:transposase
MAEKFILVWTIGGETMSMPRSTQDYALRGRKTFARAWVLALVERTIAWLNRCRRLAKDWENLNRKALAFLRLASIRLMLRKLCNLQ